MQLRIDHSATGVEASPAQLTLTIGIPRTQPLPSAAFLLRLDAVRVDGSVVRLPAGPFPAAFSGRDRNPFWRTMEIRLPGPACGSSHLDLEGRLEALVATAAPRRFLLSAFTAADGSWWSVPGAPGTALRLVRYQTMLEVQVIDGAVEQGMVVGLDAPPDAASPGTQLVPGRAGGRRAFAPLPPDGQVALLVQDALQTHARAFHWEDLPLQGPALAWEQQRRQQPFSPPQAPGMHSIRADTLAPAPALALAPGAMLAAAHPSAPLTIAQLSACTIIDLQLPLHPASASLDVQVHVPPAWGAGVLAVMPLTWSATTDTGEILPPLPQPACWTPVGMDPAGVPGAHVPASFALMVGVPRRPAQRIVHVTGTFRLRIADRLHIVRVPIRTGDKTWYRIVGHPDWAVQVDPPQAPASGAPLTFLATPALAERVHDVELVDPAGHHRAPQGLGRSTTTIGGVTDERIFYTFPDIPQGSVLEVHLAADVHCQDQPMDMTISLPLGDGLPRDGTERRASPPSPPPLPGIWQVAPGRTTRGPAGAAR